MKIVNFSHPLTAQQLAQIEAQLGVKVENVRDVRVQVNLSEPLLPQVRQILEGVRQETSYLRFIVLPGLAPVAALMMQLIPQIFEGDIPKIVRLAPVVGAVTTFEVAEIINLKEYYKLPAPATRIVVERKNWDALVPVISAWLGHYPSLKTVTPALVHAALTCYLADAPDPTAYDYAEEEKPSDRMTVEDYNFFIQVLLGRQPGSMYQTPGEGSVFVDEDGNRVVRFASYMQNREMQVRETSYGWQAEFFFGQGSTKTASAVFEAAANGDHGYVVAYGQGDSVIAQSDFLSAARPPRKGQLWLSASTKRAAEELIDYLGSRVPEVSKALSSTMLKRALLDQQARLSRLPNENEY